MRGVSVNLQHQQSKGTLTGIMWKCKHACPKIQYKQTNTTLTRAQKFSKNFCFHKNSLQTSFPKNIKIIPSAPPVTSTAQNNTKPLGLGFDCRATQPFLFIFHQSILF